MKEEDVGSFFQEELQKWKELNSTEHFAAFVEDIEDYTYSLAQIIYHKEDIVSLLVKHLSVHESLALEPVVLLVAELAKDLRIELYPCFDRLFRAILPLAKTTDPLLIEAVFTSISFLFKRSHFWRTYHPSL
jgi:U3 small nucleolar RNA-associated protein 20